MLNIHHNVFRVYMYASILLINSRPLASSGPATSNGPATTWSGNIQWFGNSAIRQHPAVRKLRDPATSSGPANRRAATRAVLHKFTSGRQHCFGNTVLLITYK